jgi:hypothetical protein
MPGDAIAESGDALVLSPHSKEFTPGNRIRDTLVDAEAATAR